MAESVTPVKQNIHLPVDACIHELRRELDIRSRAYGKWVKEGKLTQYAATEQYDRLAAAIQHLEAYEQQLLAAPPKVLDMPIAAGH